MVKGTEVEARYGGGANWFKGVIDRVNNNGTYNITYNDGDRERNVSKELIRVAAVEASSASGAFDQSFDVGSKIECRFQGGDSWFPGTISKANSDGTFYIDYDDGDVEDNVIATFIRLSQ